MQRGTLKSWLVVLAVAGLSGVACKRESRPPAQEAKSPPPASELSTADRDDIAEVVLRHEFKFFKSLPMYSSFCVGVRGADPREPFMRRFQDVGRDVVPISACREKAGQLRDSSNRPAASFEIRAVTPVSEHEATVEASWDPGHPLSGAATYEFRVKRILGYWSITDARMLAVA